MSEANDLLLIDIGNSFIKCCLAHTGKPGVTTSVKYIDEVAEIAELARNAKQVRISAVGQTEKFQFLLRELEQFDVLVAKTSTQAFGIHFAYSNVNTLGVDRWLAMVAARKSYTGNLAVVSLGTAATCDLLNTDGKHLGGWIAPGFTTLRQSLLDNTTQVFSDGCRPSDVSLGKNTSDCVNYGCLAMLEGFLLSARQRLADLGDANKIIITGGDRLLLSHLKNQHTFWEENLVLKGLSYL